MEKEKLLMSNPLVSVIIPVYNGEKYVVQALESVFKQDYQPFEVILVDDGSTDRTAQIIGKYDNVQYIYQTNQGVAAARNTGIKNSSGELIAFLDADDCWAPNKLNIQVECLLKHPHIGCTLGRQKNFLEPGTEKPFWLMEEHLLKDHVGFLPTSLIRRDIFDKVGLFNPDYKISEDVEWFSRVKDASVPVMVVPEIVLYRRIHDTNLSYQLKASGSTVLRALRASVHRKRTKNK
jgi:glycosyltransferase involved in cell wall biosynthesis